MFLFQTSAQQKGTGTAAGKTLSAQEFSKKVDQLYVRTAVSYQQVQRSIGELDFGDRLLNRSWKEILAPGMANALPTKKEMGLYKSEGEYKASFKDFQEKYNGLKSALRGKDEAKVQQALTELSKSYFALAVSQAKLVQKLEEYDLKGFEYVMPALEKAMDVGMVVGLATGVGAVASLGRAALAATLKEFLASSTEKAVASAFAGAAFFTALNFGSEYYSFGQLSGAMKRMGTDQAGALDELAGILKNAKRKDGGDGAQFDRLVLDVDVARMEARQKLKSDPSYRLDAGRVAAYFGETFAQLVVLEMGFGFFRAAGKAAAPKAKMPEAVQEPSMKAPAKKKAPVAAEEKGKSPEIDGKQPEPAGKAKTAGTEQGNWQKPETKFASLVETYRAMQTNGTKETVMYERISMVPKEKLGEFAKCMEQYASDYPDIEHPEKPITSLRGLMGSFHTWQEMIISGQRVNGDKDIVDFMRYLVDSGLPHELGCRIENLNSLLKQNFNTEYASGARTERLYGTAPVFEITCTNGRHYIAKVEDISQEVFAHNVHRIFGIEPGYRIFSGKEIGVMEVVDGATLREFLKNGMPGLDKAHLEPGSGSAAREKFLSSAMESMAQQVAFMMDDTTGGNYMVLPDGSARRIDFMDFSFQKAEGITFFDIRTDNALGVVNNTGNKHELGIMKEAFVREWARLQAEFAGNKAEARKAYAAHEWGWKAAIAGKTNFGWTPGQNLGEVMFENLKKNLSYTPEQAWDMFVDGNKRLVK
ncbi:MAG: hypothetical protein WCY41_02055 [Candidatus Micrarchaeia archaeon]